MNYTLLNIQLTFNSVVLFCLTAGLLLSCSASSTSVQTDDATPLLFFKKSRCYGTCPAYEATIYTSGRVQFVGKAYVPVTDTLYFNLTDAELKELSQNIRDLNYSELENLYKTAWSDMPSTHLYFYESGKEAKQVKHQEGGPVKLTRFIDATNELLQKYYTDTHK